MSKPAFSVSLRHNRQQDYLTEETMKTYLVGGAVRDKLLHRQTTDRDWVVVGATAEQMTNLGYMPVGSDFPVFLHPKTREEYALARTERKSGKGYGGFVCNSDPNVTLEQDLSRRDLTINAMAMDETGKLIDPYGGQDDLKKRVLRHISDAFAEDPLRVLRVARFASRYYQYGFSIAPETQLLMTNMVNEGEVDHLTAERVWKETSRALGETNPEQYFEVLRNCGALKVWFPELDILWGIPNPPKWHPEIDTGIHTMMVLQQAALLSDNLTVRFAALVHDLGKGLTEPAKWPSHQGHETAGLAAINTLCDRIKAPNDCRALALLMSEFHSHIHRAFELKPSTLLKVFNKCDAWRKPERFEQLLTTCIADARGRTGFESSEYPQADYVKQAYHAAQTVDVSSIVAAGHQGKEIKKRLDEQRIAAIKQQKDDFMQSQGESALN